MGYILGISAFYHDSSVALIDESGKVIMALHEERFSREKGTSKFPVQSLQEIAKTYIFDPNQIQAVVFYEKPIEKFFRITESIISDAPNTYDLFKNYLLSIGSKDKGYEDELISELEKVWPSRNWSHIIKFSGHHLSHAASAFYNSPFTTSAVLVVDGVGEYDCCSIHKASERGIEKLDSIEYPNSIGILYSAFTAFCGFKPNSGEYKLMGLAPFGEPVYAEKILSEIVVIDNDDLTYTLNNDVVNPNVTSDKNLVAISKVLGVKPLPFDSPPTDEILNVAASIQTVLERVMVVLAKRAKRLTGESNLCMAGGVALNCVANSEIAKHQIFKKIWVFPASGDAGGALGAAQAYLHSGLGVSRPLQKVFSPYIGNGYQKKEIKDHLDSCGAIYEEIQGLEDVSRFKRIKKILKEGGAGALFIGRAEYGPRSLGARSIVALASNKDAQVNVNLKIKFRESFRPFAPILFSKHFDKYFERLSSEVDSTLMLFTFPIQKNQRLEIENPKQSILDRVKQVRSTIPSVTHVDYSARVQTINDETPEHIKYFFENISNDTNEEVFINTSFNVRGEPIVNTPSEAFSTFVTTDLDFLYFEDFMLFKADQKINPSAFMRSFEKD